MIRSVKLQNFRSFHFAEANNLGLVNIVVGDNGAGKTALLEAMFMASGNNPETYMRTRTWRGLSKPGAISGAQVASGALWHDLFCKFDEKKLITIELKGSPNRTLTISSEERVREIPIGDAEVLAPIQFKWTDNRGNAKSSTPRLTKRGLQMPGVPPGIPGAFLVGDVNNAELADRFSMLDRRSRARPVVEALQSQFHGVEGLSVQLDETMEALVYASVSYLPEKIPLALMSSGINRLLYALITIHNFPKGAVFIDELENGLFYERMGAVWSTIVDSASEADTQLFVTTHSGEALASLRPLVAERPALFRLLRVRKDSEGNSTIRVISGEDFGAALQERVEVR
jgi:hypothetical protein